MQNFGLGDVMMARGRLAGASRYYETALAIVEAYAKARPADLAAQHELSASHERIGDVLLDQGNLVAALGS